MDQKVVSEIGTKKSTMMTGGTPVLQGTLSNFSSPIPQINHRITPSRKEKAMNIEILALAVVITAFDRKLYVCPAVIINEESFSKTNLATVSVAF